MAGRNKFANKWWSKRWLQVLESFGWKSRLQRGRSYAASARVEQIDIVPGWVYGRVQGTREKPYKVVIKLDKLSRSDLSKLRAALAEKSNLIHSLLEGEYQEELDELLQKLELFIFPQNPAEITTDCSCPDWANPCKHIAAVYYILAQEFEREPFLLWRLRGIQKEELLAGLEKPRTTSNNPLALGKEFWQTRRPLSELRFNYQKPQTKAALLKMLGPPPFWQPQKDFALEIMSYLKKLKF